MKVGTALLIVASAALASGCELCFSCCGDVQIDLDLAVHDSEGRSMFDSSTPAYFRQDSISLYTLENGKLSTIMDEDRYFHIVTPNSGKTYMNLRAHLRGEVKKKQMTTTIVRWSMHDSDTIDFEVLEKCHHLSLGNVWYNGQLANERPVDVVK